MKPLYWYILGGIALAVILYMVLRPQTTVVTVPAGVAPYIPPAPPGIKATTAQPIIGTNSGCITVFGVKIGTGC